MVLIVLIHPNESKYTCPAGKICKLNMKLGVDRWLAKKILTAAVAQMIDRGYYSKVDIDSVNGAQYTQSSSNNYVWRINTNLSLCSEESCKKVVYNVDVFEVNGVKTLSFFG